MKSRYRTAAFRHRPPTEKIPVLALPAKYKLFPKKSSSFQKTPITTPVNEDNIETLVATENEGSENKEIDENRNEVSL